MTAAAPPESDAAPAAAPIDAGQLAEVIAAYNEVTDRLQQSHEALETEVARLRRQLASKDAQLQRSRRLSALGEMAAGIAHEVRNPLAAIQLYADMARGDIADAGLGDSDAADAMSRIITAVRGLSGIVNDVLSFARQPEPDRRRVAAAEVLRRAVDAHRPAIEAAGVGVALDADPDAALDADPEMLHQAVLNLVRNAVQAMSEAAGGRSMSLSARRDGESVTLAVRDAGPGIDADAVDRIFNPFFTTRNTGTGLGLAIVHRIVEVHGGTVTVFNDGGAVFELTLPMHGGLAMADGGWADADAGAPSAIRHEPSAITRGAA